MSMIIFLEEKKTSNLEDNKKKNVNFYEVDLTQKFKLKKNYNEIYHFAAIVGVSNVNLNPHNFNK